MSKEYKEYIEREKALEKVIEVKHYDPELSGVVLHRYIKEIDLKDIPAADVAPAVKLEDLRAKYQALVAEKAKNSGDTAETYTTGYRYGHRNGQIELLQQILGIFDGVSELEETNEQRIYRPRRSDIGSKTRMGEGACPYEDMRDFAEVVQGRWISVDSSYWKPTHSSDIPVFRKTYRCSECRRRTAIAENY